MQKISLSPDFSMPAVDYAGQGNAILGIRDAGKTYTAMKAAEELLENKIPIICYDPVGVWKNLKIGTGNHKGFPVVVAGGEGSDIKLTVNNAVDIVRAAMKENVSLVIDLYSRELINKSTWIRVVQETVDLLMYENKECGLRHIFIEEAAEFIPQRLQPQHAKVYASLERLARMGRNARLGYTLINQRAEEVNKAILEISAMSLLHKQVGKNSLKSIQQWLELMQVENSKQIIQSLPGLSQGECWVIGMNTNPHKIKISSRKTYHPDPKAPINDKLISMLKTDVSGFVQKLNKQLEKEVPQKSTKIATNNAAGSSNISQDGQILEKFKQQITDLQLQLKEKDKELIWWKKLAVERGVTLNKINSLAVIEEHWPQEQFNTNVKDLSSAVTNMPVTVPKSRPIVQNGNGTVTGGAMRMLKAAAMFYPNPITKMRMAALARMSHTSGSFGTYKSTLLREGLITGEGNLFRITEEGRQRAGEVEALPTDPHELIELWCDVIGSQGGAARMLRVLGEKFPHSVTKSDLGELVGMSSTSGSFGTYLSTLKRNGLIQVNGQEIKAAEELFN